MSDDFYQCVIISERLDYFHEFFHIFVWFYQCCCFWLRKLILLTPASASSAAVVNPTGINTILAYCINTFFINSKRTLITDSRSLSRNQADCIVLDSWFFDDELLANSLFAKVWRKLKTCLSVNSKLSEKLFSLIPKMQILQLRQLHRFL